FVFRLNKNDPQNHPKLHKKSSPIRVISWIALPGEEEALNIYARRNLVWLK
ncbi:MAG: hypothetical protein QOI77_2690, partial [Blastocatellia bacterium]|nr:hypothetical protein [Blastocatellia bacterium]